MSGPNYIYGWFCLRRSKKAVTVVENESIIVVQIASQACSYLNWSEESADLAQTIMNDKTTTVTLQNNLRYEQCLACNLTGGFC